MQTLDGKHARVQLHPLIYAQARKRRVKGHRSQLGSWDMDKYCVGTLNLQKYCLVSWNLRKYRLGTWKILIWNLGKDCAGMGFRSGASLSDVHGIQCAWYKLVS